MKSNWELYNSSTLEIIGEMMKQLHLPRPVARVLNNRGLTQKEEVSRFLHSETSQLHDPFLMKDMDIAVDRVIKALRDQENILIFGDYDVDGITSVSLLYLFIKDLCGEVSFYIPDRATEGYGISIGGIEQARQSDATLIISVDCGITSIAEVKLANDYGIDVIVSDHHEQGESLPPAIAVIDPKRVDCAYPFKELAGVGVAYKLAQGVLQKLELELKYIEKYIDLVAIGSAADIVPLVDENRVFVKVGLEKLNSDGQEGILTLLETAGYHSNRIDVNHIIFGLAPRINAVGRLGKAIPAVELIITRDYLKAQHIARLLEDENRRRKQIDSQTLIEALELISQEYNPANDSVIVLSNEGWHQGVIGIVASRIIEKYYRPTVMITIENGIGKGSARSIPNFDLYSALKSCSDILLQFGGHKYAAGLTIKEENIPEFKKRFNDVTKQMINPDDLIPKIKIDDEFQLDEISFDIVHQLEELAPFGPKNPKPCFVSYDLEVVGVPRIVGKNHLKFKVGQNGTVIDAIAFNMGDKIQQLKNNRVLDMVYFAEENRWMDRVALQLRVKDFRC
ncbi:MAG: single-stranded-DNA-specific exonuclease RecJ [Candidatus Hatepunaea meridiana]|nr:single-stranded-DNA-specific exonuclease RecJ [Candidatus Hatepunaea meridiana]